MQGLKIDSTVFKHANGCSNICSTILKIILEATWQIEKIHVQFTVELEYYV